MEVTSRSSSATSTCSEEVRLIFEQSPSHTTTPPPQIGSLCTASSSSSTSIIVDVVFETSLPYALQEEVGSTDQLLQEGQKEGRSADQLMATAVAAAAITADQSTITAVATKDNTILRRLLSSSSAAATSTLLPTHPLTFTLPPTTSIVSSAFSAPPKKKEKKITPLKVSRLAKNAAVREARHKIKTVENITSANPLPLASNTLTVQNNPTFPTYPSPLVSNSLNLPYLLPIHTKAIAKAINFQYDVHLFNCFQDKRIHMEADNLLKSISLHAHKRRLACEQSHAKKERRMCKIAKLEKDIQLDSTYLESVRFIMSHKAYGIKEQAQYERFSAERLIFEGYQGNVKYFKP